MVEKKIRSLINNVQPDPAVDQLRLSQRQLRPINTKPSEDASDNQLNGENESNTVQTDEEIKSQETESKRETVVKPVMNQVSQPVPLSSNDRNNSLSDAPTASLPQRGRPIVHTDPRYRSDMPVKISGYNKSRISALTDSKLGNVTMDQAITLLIDFYLEKGLSKDEFTLVDRMTEEYMEILKQQPKYRGYFQ